MSRSLKKGPHVDYKLYLKVEKQETAGIDANSTTKSLRRTLIL